MKHTRIWAESTWEIMLKVEDVADFDHARKPFRAHNVRLRWVTGGPLANGVYAVIYGRRVLKTRKLGCEAQYPLFVGPNAPEWLRELVTAYQDQVQRDRS